MRHRNPGSAPAGSRPVLSRSSRQFVGQTWACPFLFQCGSGKAGSLYVQPSKRLPRPGTGSSQRDFPTQEGSIGDERKKLARRRGLRGAGPGDFLQEKPSISASGEQLERDKQGKRISGFQALQRGYHACDGIVERSSAVKVRLPEFLQQLEIVIPAALIQAFAQRIRSITAAGHTAILVASGRARSTKHRT